MQGWWRSRVAARGAPLHSCDGTRLQPAARRSYPDRHLPPESRHDSLLRPAPRRAPAPGRARPIDAACRRPGRLARQRLRAAGAGRMARRLQRERPRAAGSLPRPLLAHVRRERHAPVPRPDRRLPPDPARAGRAGIGAGAGAGGGIGNRRAGVGGAARGQAAAARTAGRRHARADAVVRLRLHGRQRQGVAGFGATVAGPKA